MAMMPMEFDEGVESYSSSDNQFNEFKCGNVVTIVIMNKSVTATAAGWKTIGTIRAGFRPPIEMRFAIMDNSDGTRCRVGRINASTGTFEVYCIAAETIGCVCVVTYIVS